MTVATERGFPVAWLPEATVHRLRGHQSSDLRTADLRAQVQSLSLTPPGLPPEAVLCVRQLTVPLQGRLNRDPAAWQTAALDQLSALHRRAVRPLWEPVPPAAEAVLFDHPADLLSGLALAWRRGELQRWWWAGLCTPAQLANPAVLWLAAPQWLPRMLATLALHSEASAFVEALGTAQAEALLRSVLDCFGLGASLVPISAGMAGTSADMHLQAENEGAAPAPEHSHSSPSANPWAGHWASLLPGWSADQQAALLPECPARLNGPADWLLGLGLLLHRAPALLRTAALPGTLTRPYNSAGPLSGPDAPTRLPVGERAAQQAEPLSAGHLHDASAIPGPESEHGAVLPVEQAAQLPADERQALRTGPPALPALQTTSEPPPSASASPRPSRPAPDAPTRIVSAFGGLLYLLNVAMQMRLYPDFTQPSPAQPGLGLSPWTLLALIGERWLGDAFRADPLAAQLAELSGQHADLRAFVPPAEWRFPAHWLAVFPEEAACTWSWKERRLLLHHPAGFWLYDAECSDPAAILGAYPHVQCRPVAEPESAPKDPLDRWLTRLSAAWIARLERALGPGGAVTLCTQAARIERRAERLTASFDLASHPLEVRLAGLDRDPGWIGAAGLSVAFRYESGS